MKTKHFSRSLWGALIGVAMTGIAGMVIVGAAGFASAGVKHPEFTVQAIADAGAAAPADRKIKHYRDPMGLPDTSPTPKKDSMGMDYIPVYEGEDSKDAPAKMSPGKMQRSDVKSEPAAAAPADRKIKYYRNPMGLPDTSPAKGFNGDGLHPGL